MFMWEAGMSESRSAKSRLRYLMENPRQQQIADYFALSVPRFAARA
jgi:hypothetical protein